VYGAGKQTSYVRSLHYLRTVKLLENKHHMYGHYII